MFAQPAQERLLPADFEASAVLFRVAAADGQGDPINRFELVTDETGTDSSEIFNLLTARNNGNVRLSPSIDKLPVVSLTFSVLAFDDRTLCQTGPRQPRFTDGCRTASTTTLHIADIAHLQRGLSLALQRVSNLVQWWSSKKTQLPQPRWHGMTVSF